MPAVVDSNVARVALKLQLDSSCGWEVVQSISPSPRLSLNKPDKAAADSAIARPLATIVVAKRDDGAITDDARARNFPTWVPGSVHTIEQRSIGE